MTPTEIKAAAEVMLAYAKMCEEKGEAYAKARIQSKDNHEDNWIDYQAVPCGPLWDWKHGTYRIKPEPREWWIVITKKGGHHDVHDAYRVQQALCANQSQVHVREVLE